MTKAQALAQARSEINLGMDGRSIRVYDAKLDATRVRPATDYHVARACVTEYRLERALILLGYSEDKAHDLAGVWDTGRLESRLASATIEDAK